MRKIIIGSLVAVLSLTSAQAVLAQGGDDPAEVRKSVINTADRTVERTVKEVENSTDVSESEASESLRDTMKSQREQIEERKSELRDEMKKKLEDRKEKLEGRRLAQCQNRQANINQLIDKSASIGKERLARIQRFEEGVKAFYVKQALSSDEYDAAVQAVDRKEAAAIAALDVASSQEFECNDVDGLNPSGGIESSHEAKRIALKEYKDAVKNLIVVVKAAFADKKAASEVNQ